MGKPDVFRDGFDGTGGFVALIIFVVLEQTPIYCEKVIGELIHWPDHADLVLLPNSST